MMDGGIAKWRQWLKEKNLLDDEQMAKKLGLTMLEFNIATKHYIIEGVTHSGGYGRTALRGFDPNLTLTAEQRQKIDKLVTHRADDAAEMLGITRRQFDKIRKYLGIDRDGQFNIAFNVSLYLYSQATIKKMIPYAEALRRGEPLPPLPPEPEPTPEVKFGRQIKARRDQRGLREVCQEINDPAVTPSTLSRAEQGKLISSEAAAAIRAWLEAKDS